MQLKSVLVCSASGLALMLLAGAASAQSDQPLETVVVTGIRASLAQGLQIKRDSTQVVESIIAEDIGKLPDNNVVEALQRLSGVQVTNRGGGQVGALYIRGMNDVETTWNGRKIFTASGLYFSVQDMPATMVRRLDVFKTRESKQIETGIAGQLDMQTYRPFDFDGMQISAQAQGTYQEQRGAFDPNISAMFSDRWGTDMGEVGMLANVSWSVVRFRDESATPGALVAFARETNMPVGSGAANLCTPSNPGGWTPLERIFNNDCRAPNLATSDPTDLALLWQPGLVAGLPETTSATLNINGVNSPYYLARDAVFQSDFTGKRTRPNANLAFQWAPNSNSEYTLEIMYNGYRNETFNNLFFSFVDWWGDFSGATPRINPATSFTLFPNTNIMKTRHVGSVYGFNSGDLTSEKTNSFVYGLSGKWNIGQRFKLQADASYQQSIFDNQFYAMRIDRVAPDIYVDFNAGGGYLAFNFGSGQNLLTQPSAWNTAQIYDNGAHRAGQAYTLAFDGTYDLDGITGPLKDVHFGMRRDERGSKEATRQASNWHGQNLSTMPAGILSYNSNFFDGRADVPTSWVNVDGRYIYTHRNELNQIWGGQLTDVSFLLLNQTFTINEVNTSAYVEGDFSHDIMGRPLTVNAGVRWVQVEDSMVFASTTSGKAYVQKFLPSATLTFEPIDDVKLRFNYGETLRRPNFTDLNPTYILNADVTGIHYGTGTRGNPDLKPTHSKNMDLSAEWYFAPSSAIYSTLFRRDIDGLVVPLNVSITLPGADILARYNTNNFIINQPVNASKGQMKGVEVGLIYFPDYLPWYADGLGVQGSLTVLSSTQNIPQTDTTGHIVSQLTEQFFGVSPLSYNTTLIYEKNNLGARLSYVWRSKFHYDNEGANFANPLGRWRRPESSLDLQLSYKFDKFMVTFDAVNLLNSVQQTYYHAGGQGSPETTDFGTVLLSRSFSLGLRYSLN